MDKVYLALRMVELAAEKTKLENEYREGVSLLRSMEVRAGEAALCAPAAPVATRATSVCSCSKSAANWSRGRSC